MSDHFNSFLMNDVLIRLEEQSFFADIGEERTLCFVQDALALSRHHDGNPGALRQGICSDCRTADSIEIDSEEAETSPREAAVSYGFISPRVAQRLRRYASMLSDCLRGSRSVGEQPPWIVPVLVYNGAPAWTPRSSTEGCNAFEYTFIDVGRLRPDEVQSHQPVAALASPKTAADRNPPLLGVTDCDVDLHRARDYPSGRGTEGPPWRTRSRPRNLIRSLWWPGSSASCRPTRRRSGCCCGRC